MITDQEPVSDQLSLVSQGDTAPSSFFAEELDIIALRLWQRCNCLETIGDECSLCRGEAQQCLAMCQ
jgi:hypothetical protein